MEGVTIIADARVLTCNPRLPGGRLSIVVRDGRIADVSPNSRLLISLYPGSETIDASDKIVTPGFVNAHFHTESLLLKDLTAGRHLSLWAQDFRMQERMNRLMDAACQEDLRSLYLTSCFNHLRCGTTCVGEFPPMIDGRGLSTILQAMKRTEIKSVVALQNWDQVIESRNIPADRQKFAMSLGRELDFTVYTFESITRAAREQKLALVAHVAEQKEHMETVKRNFQKGMVTLLRDFKVLQPPTVLVHLNHLTDDEMALVEESGCPVVLCTRSAAMKRTGYPALRYLASRGIRACLGTDWENVDMIEEMRFVSILPLMFAGMPNYTPLELLSMATVNGAEALGLDNEIGSIAQGKRADLVFFDMSGLRTDLLSDDPTPEALASFLLNHLSTRDITDVMLDGKFCVADGEVTGMPEEEILAGFRKTMEKFSLIGSAPAAAPEAPRAKPAMHPKIIPFVASERVATSTDGFDEGFTVVERPQAETPAEEKSAAAKANQSKEAPPGPKKVPPARRPAPPANEPREQGTPRPELSKNVRKVFGEDDDPLV